jgi:hypothetical protein
MSNFTHFFYPDRPLRTPYTTVNGRIHTIYGGLRAFFRKLRYIDRRFVAVSYHPVHYRRIYPYDGEFNFVANSFPSTKINISA